MDTFASLIFSSSTLWLWRSICSHVEIHHPMLRSSQNNKFDAAMWETWCRVNGHVPNQLRTYIYIYTIYIYTCVPTLQSQEPGLNIQDCQRVTYIASCCDLFPLCTTRGAWLEKTALHRLLWILVKTSSCWATCFGIESTSNRSVVKKKRE